jgi:hypothetical protein
MGDRLLDPARPRPFRVTIAGMERRTAALVHQARRRRWSVRRLRREVTAAADELLAVAVRRALTRRARSDE